MVELLKEFPNHVVAYRAAGIVEKEEYERIVMTRVDEAAATYKKFNFIVKLETDIQNYSLPAFIVYLKISFKHFTKWNRMAIVSDQRWVQTSYEILSKVVPGEIRGYSLNEFESAKKWVLEPLEAGDENMIRSV